MLEEAAHKIPEPVRHPNSAYRSTRLFTSASPKMTQPPFREAIWSLPRNCERPCNRHLQPARPSYFYSHSTWWPRTGLTHWV